MRELAPFMVWISGTLESIWGWSEPMSERNASWFGLGQRHRQHSRYQTTNGL